MKGIFITISLLALFLLCPQAMASTITVPSDYTTIQEAVPLPVCLDTTNHQAVEAGLEVHNNQWGRPLINSTSNDPERFPMLELAAKHHAQIIGLTVGKGGLPADAEERASVAAEIMARAAEFGVPLEDVYLDPLVLQTG